jgi:hypothetical protein
MMLVAFCLRGTLLFSPIFLFFLFSQFFASSIFYPFVPLLAKSVFEKLSFGRSIPLAPLQKGANVVKVPSHPPLREQLMSITERGA